MRETDAMPNVVIAVARCSYTKELFGMRFEERSHHRWIADWAFPINQSLAQREGYDRNKIQGSFDFDGNYPGCPTCEALSMFQCSCGKIACWKPKHLPCRETCPWCGITVTLDRSMDWLATGGDL